MRGVNYHGDLARGVASETRMWGPCGEFGRVELAVAREETPNSAPVARSFLASGGFVVVVWRVVVHLEVRGTVGRVNRQAFQSVNRSEIVESP